MKKRLALNLGNNDIAMLDFFRLINDQKIAGIKTDVRHRISYGPDKIGRETPANTILVEAQF